MTGQTIRHMVIFNLKAEKESDAARDFLAYCEHTLPQIPGVTKFESLRQVSPKNSYDYGFSMEFVDAAAYQAYNDHPLHTGLVSTRWVPEVSDFLEIDFMV